MSFDPYTLVPVILFPLAMASSVAIRLFSRRGIKRQAKRALDDVRADPHELEYRLRSVIEAYADSPADADVPMQAELLASLTELRALHAVLCIECGLLELAQQTLGGAEKETPALTLARARLQLAALQRTNSARTFSRNVGRARTDSTSCCHGATLAVSGSLVTSCRTTPNFGSST